MALDPESLKKKKGFKKMAQSLREQSTMLTEYPVILNVDLKGLEGGGVLGSERGSPRM